jgi:hypothetical protein
MYFGFRFLDVPNVCFLLCLKKNGFGLVGLLGLLLARDGAGYFELEFREAETTFYTSETGQ